MIKAAEPLANGSLLDHTAEAEEWARPPYSDSGPSAVWGFSVGRRGLEPLTPCASCKCATNCANGPCRPW